MCVVVVLVVTQGILVGTVMILLRNIWGYAYTSKVEVVKQIAIMFPILAAGNLIDALQSVLAGLFLLITISLIYCLHKG